MKYSILGFVCDTVRSEADGRSTLVGVFHSSFAVPGFPFPLPIGVFVKISPIPAPSTPVLIELTVDEQVEISATLTTPLVEDQEKDNDQALHLALDRPIVQFQRPGVLELWAEVGGQGRQRLARINVQEVFVEAET